MSRSQAGGVPLIIVIVVLALVVIGALGFVFWQNFIKNGADSMATVSSFEECKKAPGSILQETYPEQCVTKDGQVFTGPQNNGEGDKLATFCTPAEKLCFDHQSDWKITKLETPNAEPGSKTDNIRIGSADNEFELLFTTGISGLGGICEDESKKDAIVVAAVPIAGLKGYATEYSQDAAMVSQTVYQNDKGKFIAALYVTTDPDFAKPGTVRACGISFSQFFVGKNSRISSDYEEAGAIRFGYTGNNFYGEKVVEYDTADAAKAAYATDNYKIATALLASSRYN
jgi:hypothetical protein